MDYDVYAELFDRVKAAHPGVNVEGEQSDRRHEQTKAMIEEEEHLRSLNLSVGHQEEDQSDGTESHFSAGSETSSGEKTSDEDDEAEEQVK